MQKLFSMFPRGAPGAALLLLRLFVGAQLVADAAVALSEPNLFLAAVLVACALAIVIGITTPIAALLAALIATTGLSTHSTQAALHSSAPIVVGIALALLGPGAFSIDARLFGRRLVEFGPEIEDDR